MKSRQKTVFIDARFVCDRGKIDARRIAAYFTANGYHITTNPKDAGLIVFNCCGFSTAVAETGLRELKRYQQLGVELLVVGGLPETDTDALRQIYTGNSLSHKDLGTLDRFYPNHAVSIDEIEDQHTPWLTMDTTTLRARLRGFTLRHASTRKALFSTSDYILRHRVGDDYLILGNPMDLPTSDVFRLRISWGCLFNCSYCAIKNATGTFRSKPQEDCVQAFTSGLRDGYHTFHIIGVDPASYGHDIGLTYPQLLQQLCAQNGDYQFRLEAVHPAWAVKYQTELADLCRTSRIRAMSVPFQSSSPRILKLMNRYADLTKMKETLKKLKEAQPKMALATNVIVGFPTETDSEFHDTLNYIDEAGFDLGVIFPISLKPGTKASTIQPPIEPQEIKDRMTTAQTVLKKQGYGVVHIHGQGLWFGRPLKRTTT